MLQDPNRHPVMLLLKLGQREHMERFRKGQLFMNTLKYFRDLESDPARADHYEGATHIFQPKDVIITISAPGFGDFVIDSKDLTAAPTWSMSSEQRCNIFCLYAISAPVNGTLFPSEHEWFGDSMVLVINTQEFLDRVVAAAKARNVSGKGKQVEYFDNEAYTGKLNRFRKSKRFAHQREYRIAIDSRRDGPIHVRHRGYHRYYV